MRLRTRSPLLTYLLATCTVRYKSHLVTISSKCFHKSPAKCPAFPCHFLPYMLCLPAPCANRWGRN